MFWQSILQTLSFTGVEDITVWQDVFISALIIPPVFLILRTLWLWFDKNRPLHSLLRGYLENENEVFIFHSQLSGADNNWHFNTNQKYITKYPDPSPTNKNRFGIQKKLNIDPVWSQGDGECLTDIHNVLGKAGKIENIKIGDLINDWSVGQKPIFTVGFNPKTYKLMEGCEPIYFNLINGTKLSIKDCETEVDSLLPNDGGIIQKTFFKKSNIPVFILAGLGTLGTSVAGYFLRNNCIDIGKLYGNKSFCILLKAKIDEGRNSTVIHCVYPKPSLHRILMYPFAYLKFRKQLA